MKANYEDKLISESMIVAMAEGDREAMERVIEYYNPMLDKCFSRMVKRMNLIRDILPEEDIKQEVRQEFFRALLHFEI